MIIKSNLNKKRKIFLIIITIFIIFSLITLNTYANETDEVYLVSIKGTIDLGLSSYVQRALEEAVLNKAKMVILEIDTFGGRVDAATQIRDKIMSLNIPSVAYVKNRAWSAGALIALSAEYILIDKSASIGAAEPKPADEKNISALRAEFTSTALSRGRSEDIAAAMVDKDVEIKGIIEKDKILTLNAEQAIKLNFVDGNASSIEEVLNFLNLKDAKIVYIYPNWAENISRFVTNPVVSPLLLSIGFLGLIIEFWTLGWGIAGSIGIISLSLFFGGHIIVGLAGFETIILFVIGLLLLLVEIFLPTSTSAISIDNISKAVPASKPFFNTVLEILSGFSKTFLCASDEPMVVTIPSPTLAIIVSSPAPPTKRSMLALTVTLAVAIT
ncbi:unnamed protein product [marine sediment metagenome]|uniref:NfeD-like C-terminal domain-containing protein n=1 Tax=marine sediment metagenome TaxID=412755 RepID=X1KY64_9ZZZZ